MKGKKGFQKGHGQYSHRPASAPAYCSSCQKQLAKSPSKRGKSGLCHHCVVSRPFDDTHKERIGDALRGKEKLAEHCEKMKVWAIKRFADPRNHPMWLGGKSFEPYSYQFNKQLKEGIRLRDGYQCQECSRHENMLGQNLSIHHIDYDKNNCLPENLISLCNTCHLQTNVRRDEWTAHFQHFMNTVRIEEGFGRPSLNRDKVCPI